MVDLLHEALHTICLIVLPRVQMATGDLAQPLQHWWLEAQLDRPLVHIPHLSLRLASKYNYNKHAFFHTALNAHLFCRYRGRC